MKPKPTGGFYGFGTKEWIFNTVIFISNFCILETEQLNKAAF